MPGSRSSGGSVMTRPPAGTETAAPRAKAGKAATPAPQHCISRPAQAQQCRNCGQQVIVAIEGGVTVGCDLAALDIRAELAARTAGLLTYDLHRIAGRKAYLIYRDPLRMQKRARPVLAAHRCPDGRRGLFEWHIPDGRSRASPIPPPAASTATPAPY